MSYDKQTWKSGDVVTSAKLNHMEDGIAGGGSGGGDTFTFTITYDNADPVCDKTQAEIIEAIEARKVVVGYFYDDATEGEETTLSLPVVYYSDNTTDGKMLMCQSAVNVPNMTTVNVTTFLIASDNTITNMSDTRYYESN